MSLQLIIQPQSTSLYENFISFREAVYGKKPNERLLVRINPVHLLSSSIYSEALQFSSYNAWLALILCYNNSLPLVYVMCACILEAQTKIMRMEDPKIVDTFKDHVSDLRSYFLSVLRSPRLPVECTCY